MSARKRIAFLDEHLLGVRDADADGLVDADEGIVGSDPARFDTDGDGQRDGDEVSAGTDPLAADSVFRIRSIAPQVDDDGLGSMALHVDGGRADDVIQYAGALNNTFVPWSTVASDRIDGGLRAAAALADHPRGYLRVHRAEAKAATAMVGWRDGLLQRAADETRTNHLAAPFVGRTLHQANAVQEGDVLRLETPFRGDLPPAGAIAIVVRDQARVLATTHPEDRGAQGQWWNVHDVTGTRVSLAPPAPHKDVPQTQGTVSVALVARATLADVFVSGIGLAVGDRAVTADGVFEYAGDEQWITDAGDAVGATAIGVGPTEGFVLEVAPGAPTPYVSAGFVPEGDIVAYVAAEANTLLAAPYAEDIPIGKAGLLTSGVAWGEKLYVNDPTLRSYAGDDQGIALVGLRWWAGYWLYPGEDLWAPAEDEWDAYARELRTKYKRFLRHGRGLCRQLRAAGGALPSTRARRGPGAADSATLLPRPPQPPYRNTIP